MARLLGTEREGDADVRWYDDGDQIAVHYHQDAQSVVDAVSAANLDGVKTHEGLGRPAFEVPVVAAMAWAQERGIPWEKLLYSNEYDDEFKRFAKEHSRLQYRPERKVFGA